MHTQLGASAGDQALLRRPPAHGPGTQVRNKGPGTDDRWSAGLNGIDVYQAAQALGPGLADRARESGWGRGTRLTGRQQQHGHTALDGNSEALQGIAGELHGRHHKTIGLTDKGSGPPLGLATGDDVQHLQGFFQMGVVTPAGTGMFAGPRHRTVGGVEVHLIGVFNVPQHTHALEHMDVLAVIGDPGEVIKIPGRGGAIFVLHRVGDHDRSARRGKMHPGTRQVEIVFGVLGVQGQVAARLGQHILHHRPGHA